MRVVYSVRVVHIVFVLVCLICLLGRTEICSSMGYAQFEREVQMATRRDSNGSCEVALTKYLDFYVYQPFRGVDLSDWHRENETLPEFVKRTKSNTTIYGGSSGDSGRHRRQANGTEAAEEEQKIFRPKESKYLTSCVTADWRGIVSDHLFPAGLLRAVLTCSSLLLTILLLEVGYAFFFGQQYTKFGTIFLSCVHVLLTLISAISMFLFRSHWYKAWELGLVETPLYPSEWLLLETVTWLLGLFFCLEMFLKHFLNGQFVYSLSNELARLEGVRTHIISASDDALRSSYELVSQ